MHPFKLKYFAPLLIIILMIANLTGCSFKPATQQDGPPPQTLNPNFIRNAVVRPLPKSKYGNPSSYVVDGKRYFVLPTARGYRQRGIASWYGTKFHGKLTSTREPYNLYAMTAASPILPLPCFVRVTNLTNHRSVIVKVNDRGPFEDNRIIDLSYAAASKLKMLKHGTAPVEVVALTPNESAIPNNIPNEMNDSSSAIYFQIGAFHDYSNAKRLQHQAQQAMPYKVFIKNSIVNGRRIYLVKIGPLNSQRDVSRVEHILGGMPS